MPETGFQKEKSLVDLVFLRLHILGYNTFVEKKQEQAFLLVPFSPVGTKVDGTMETIPYTNYNILSQICFQQILYLQE